MLGNRLTIAGLIFLLPAIVGVVFVITAFIFGLTAAVIVTALLALFFALPWFALPLRTTRAKTASLLRETEPGVGYGPFRGR